jgi:MFS family permease
LEKGSKSFFNVWVTGITSFLTDVSTEMVYPLLPLYLTLRLGAGPEIVGIIEGIAESLASFLKVFSGFISDKLGRRKPLAIFGYASSTVGKFFLYISTSWWWVLLGRGIDRFGKGVRTAPRDAIIADSTDHSNRGQAFGLHRTLDTLGAVVGIIIAYFLFINLRERASIYNLIFLFSLIPAFLGVFILFLVKETGRGKREKKVLRLSSFRNLPLRLKGFLIVVFLFTLGNSSNQFLILRAKNIGFTVSESILLYLVFNIVYGLSSYPAGKISDRVGRRALIVLGYLSYGLVYFGFAFFTHSYLIWTLFALYGIYMGFTEGVEKALVADLSPIDLRATVIGLHATLVGLGLFPASFLAGVLWRFLGAKAPFIFGGAMGVLASLGMLYVLRLPEE